MKLKTLLPLILLLQLLTQTSYAQTRTESQNAQNSTYGIEPGQLYPGALVLELMEAAEAEIENAVSEAYAEGYKAAMLRYAPEATMYKAGLETLKKELEAERKKARFFWPAIGASAGISFAGGFLLHFFAGRQ